MRPAARTSTLGLISGRSQNVPSFNERSEAARMAMRGFDEMPKSLRVFLHEYAAAFPQKSIVQIIEVLKGGYGVTITSPDGKTHRIEPDPPKRR